MDEEGRRASLTLKPGPGRPREVSVLVRPHGAPVWISGTRGGQPRRPAELRMGGEAGPARSVPVMVPDVEDVYALFSPPPAGVPGVALWITPTRPGEAPGFGAEARETLGALGYLR